MLSVGCIVVFFNSLDPRSYEAGRKKYGARTQDEDKRLVDHRVDFMKFCMTLGFEGYYARPSHSDYKRSDLPPRWYWPFEFLTHFATAVMAERRRLGHTELPSDYPISIPELEENLKADFMAFAPHHLCAVFNKRLHALGHNKDSFKNHAGSYWYPSEVTSNAVAVDSEEQGWVSCSLQDGFDELRVLDGTPTEYIVECPPWLMSRVSSSDKRAGVPLPEEVLQKRVKLTSRPA